MKIKNILMLLTGVVVAVMLALSIILFFIITNLNKNNQLVIHTYQVINHADELTSNMLDQETGVRGYLATGNTDYLEPYNIGLNAFGGNLANLKEIVSDNPSQVAKLEDIEETAHQWHLQAADIYLSIKDDIVNSEAKVAELHTMIESGIGKQKMDAIRILAESIEDNALGLNIMYNMVNMETGVRGYLIDGVESSLEPYTQGETNLPGYLNQADSLLLTSAINDWITNVAEVEINLKRDSKTFLTQDDLLARMSLHLGKKNMDQFKLEIGEFINVEEELLNTRNEAASRQSTNSIVAIITALVLGLIMAVIQKISIDKITLPLSSFANKMKEFDSNDFDVDATIDNSSISEVVNLSQGYSMLLHELRDNLDIREQQDWVQKGHMKINEISESNNDITNLLDKFISFTTKKINGQLGAVYLLNEKSEENVYELRSSYAFDNKEDFPTSYKNGEGLIGQAVSEKDTILINNIPPDYLSIKSGLGSTKPANILIVPCIYLNKVIAVFEIASIFEFSDLMLDFINFAKVSIGIAINNILNYEIVEQLLIVSNESNEKLQTQQEELRVSNEELEQQSITLKNSQSELESQQEELKVVNEELEENTELLELQKKNLEQKNEDLKLSQKIVEEKTTDLILSNKYKSEFLANMSHELRTPLNSILILSELLGEKSSVLPKKQKEFANTINSSGKDLLNLINDILDLSKVEAGKVDINISEMNIEDFKIELVGLFEQVSIKENLQFAVNISDKLPKCISADEVKIKQIVKNLLSNAFKFTKKGSVVLNIKDYENKIQFEVSDTGIGIAEDKVNTIFEAFKQEDGTISRQYGGTGLGLSISIEYANLLGGTLDVESLKGIGSKFTLTLPIAYDTDRFKKNENNIAKKTSEDIKNKVNENEEEKLYNKPSAMFYIPDDRNNIDSTDKVLLIVDDDPVFAKTIMEISKTNNFKVIIAETGETGLYLADYYMPTGIILDIKLPGINGWEVLEKLKSNNKTKNIPVNIVSGKDYKSKSEGENFKFFQKPVSKTQIEAILQDADLEGYTINKILIIEITDTNQKTLVDLLKHNYRGIEVICSASDSEALQILAEQSIDLVVLDLDTLGENEMDFIEKMKTKDGASTIPVIIYTNREISTQTEKNLRKKAENIIIKDGSSTQRLLDEIKIFVNNVKKNRLSSVTDALNGEIFSDKVVLIVDDDMRNVFALSSILESKGIDTEIANNGVEAIEKLKSTDNIDLVLMDIMMPIMDGYEAMRQIRKMKKFKDLPIVALTAKAMKGDKEACVAAGANEYMSKPVDKNKLMSLLRVWL